MSIEVKDLTKRFGAVTAVDGVSFTVEEGSLTALLGPSGSGKTSVLRTIAGLEEPDCGSVWIGGEDVTRTPARKRNVGFVFQHYALFPHMKVKDNIAFPLKVRRWPRRQINERVGELLDLLRLEGLENRYPGQVSGGQRQRVALARALASHPKVLLLDEPFSALDARVREELREWLRGLHDRLHVTSLFVTHDQTEAMELADRMVILNEGRVAQSGRPDEAYARPRSAFVMQFLGKANLLRGTAEHGYADLAGLRVRYPSANGTAVPVIGYVRPHDLQITRHPSGGRALPATVVRVIANGPALKVQMVAEQSDDVLVAEISHEQQEFLGLAGGDLVYARPLDVRVFDAEERPQRA
jgi:sulfate transport system ATP-binding protein